MRRSLSNSKGIRWRPSRQVIQRRIPGPILPAMLDQQSLTAHMLHLCRGRTFRVEVLQQYKRPLLAHEYQHLPSATAGVLERNVHLYCDDQPWVYAHSIIPIATLTGPQRRLARMGNQPLGAALFADPLMQRDIIEFGTMDQRCSLFAAATAPLAEQPKEIWGRRSRFILHNSPLLVAEFFLPPWGNDDF